MTALSRYDRARKALAEARTVYEVKDVLAKGAGLATYAREAKDEALMADATAIVRRATRRLGEVMAEKKAAGELAKGGGLRGKKYPTALAELGVDKNLAIRARAAAAMPEAEFEAALAKLVRLAVATVIGDKAVLGEARAERQADKQGRRRAREADLSAKQQALPIARYGVILADPPWRFQPWSSETGMDRAADNHYPTSSVEQICALDVASIAAEDCALFLWATAPMLPHALMVLGAWGFDYRSHCIWAKDRPGTGYWFRNMHELLLVGVRGKIPAPAMGEQYLSVIGAPVGKHSAKPEGFHQVVERYFPTLPKIELYRRGRARPGWSAWGNQAGALRAAE